MLELNARGHARNADSQFLDMAADCEDVAHID